MIRGYVEQPSPRSGGSLTLRVATDAPRFRVEFYRCGPELVRCGGSPWLDGVRSPPHLPFQDWGQPGLDPDGQPLAPWPAYPFPVPAHWSSGVYVAVLVEGDGAGRDRADPDRTTPEGRDCRALFVVRPARSGARTPILYKVPLLTYHAYNAMGGWCLYNMRDGVPPGVGLHRPGGGTGATPYDVTNPDPFDPTPRQTFALWDARFIAWLEGAGYRADYCTDVDLHRDGADLLAGYRLPAATAIEPSWVPLIPTTIGTSVIPGLLRTIGHPPPWPRTLGRSVHTFRCGSSPAGTVGAFHDGHYDDSVVVYALPVTWLPRRGLSRRLRDGVVDGQQAGEVGDLQDPDHVRLRRDHAQPAAAPGGGLVDLCHEVQRAGVAGLDAGQVEHDVWPVCGGEGQQGLPHRFDRVEVEPALRYHDGVARAV